MNRLAFRGLRERKARTAFTLLAVVLGVALIAGTFVLTDTISKSFDKLVADRGRERRRQGPIAQHRRRLRARDAASPFPRLGRGAGARGRRRRRRRRRLPRSCPSPWSTTAASASGRPSGAPTLAFSAVSERFDAFEYDGPRSPRPTARSPCPQTAAEDAGVQVGDRIRVQGTQTIRAYEMVGTHHVRRGGLDGRRGVHRPHAAGGPGTRRRARQGHRHRRAGRARGHAGRAQAAHQRAGRSGRARAHRRGGLPAGVQGPVADPRLPDARAARLRPDRAARRRLRHLQHLHDHRRPAHARVRDAAHDRRVAPAGAVGGRARGAADRARGLRARPVRRDRARAAPGWPARHGRVRPAEHRARDRARARSPSRSSSAPS